MGVEQRVKELVEEKIADRPELFLVEVKMLLNNKLIVKVDGDEGITIQDCADISKHVGFHLEEENVVDSAYNLEVSSPGVGEPLILRRQYIKNIGRDLGIRLVNGSTKEGTLLAVNSENISLEEFKKPTGKSKSKKVEKEEISLPFEEIAEVKVLISFK